MQASTRLVLSLLLQDGVKLVNSSIMGDTSELTVLHYRAEKYHLKRRYTPSPQKQERQRYDRDALCTRKQMTDYSQKRKGVMSEFELVIGAIGSCCHEFEHRSAALSLEKGEPTPDSSSLGPTIHQGVLDVSAHFMFVLPPY